MKGKHHSAHEHHDIHAHVKHHSMKHHRPHRKHGGKVEEGEMAHDETPTDVYAGAGSPTVKEASKKKRGGALKHHAHHMKHVEAHGEHSKHRLDRPARKHGGKVGGGAEMHPLSAASKVRTPPGRDVDSEYD
jgi:hypothetical protein